MKYLIYTNSIIQLVMLVFVPYQILMIQEISKNLPLVLGIGMIAGGLTSISIGKLSDKNRKNTFLFGTILLTFVVLLYTIISSIIGIIILQILYGISFAIYQISEKALIADKSIEIGRDVGRYTTVLYVISGIALIISSLFILPVYYLFPSIALLLLIPNIIIYKFI